LKSVFSSSNSPSLRKVIIYSPSSVENLLILQNPYEQKVEDFKKKLEESQKTRSRVKYENKVKEYEEKVSECKLIIKNKKEQLKTKGNLMKGGALFINATKHYLKSVRDESALPEWRGGKLLIILDEGVLNTDDYCKTREFIKRYFYIKAIISLSRDTFVPVSNTSNKTSIMYAVKKQDPDAIQREPIFFAHAEKVGMDTKKKVCPNHLFNNGNDILSKYQEFKTVVSDSYDGLQFNREKFLNQGFEKGIIT